MNIKRTNLIIFGTVGLVVMGSWNMTIWTVFNYLEVVPAMVLASFLCTKSYFDFIRNSLRKQKLSEDNQ